MATSNGATGSKGNLRDGEQPPVAQPVGYQPQPFQMPPVTNPGYVGFQACAECHLQRVEECVPTSHFQTCRIPTLERMPAAFTSDNPNDRTLRLPGTDVSFEMGYRDGKFFQAAVQGSKRVESTIDLVYGAKTKSDEVYLSWHADDSMWELPVAWVFAEDCWGAAGFDRQQGTDFSRELTVRCFECHMTWFEHIPGTLSGYRRDELLLGVTCERCHGPGREHIAYHHAHPEAKDAQAIVYPGALERERLIEVCTQCHSNSIRHRGPALSFRPGDKLVDHYRFVHPKYGEDDHVADQISDLQQSECFEQSEMTCVTCHDPHLTGQATHGMTFQEACTQCHQPAACKQREHVPAAVADKCVECHMRQYAKINVNFDLANDSYVPPLQRSQHHIAVDEIATNEVLYKWHKQQSGEDSARQAEALKSKLLKHWFSAGEQCAAEGRFTAAVAMMREILRLDEMHIEARQRLDEYAQQQRAFDDLLSSAQHALRQQRHTEAIDMFKRVLEIHPENATAMGRLGTIYAQQGQRELAEEYLEKVTEIDPDNQYGVSMSAWLAFLDQNYAVAAEKYAAADAIEPFNSRINQLWGTSLARSGKLKEGVARLQVALQSDPRNLEAMQELIDVYMTLGEHSQAVHWAEQAARLTEHQSLRELMVLAECQVAHGEQQKAGDVVQLALQVATGQPETQVEIRRWAASQNVQVK
ncbi:MAG: tetratricopeptide repeat protein [Pirellulaceae bacterium]